MKIQGILALISLCACIAFGFIRGDVPEWLIGLTGIAWGFWFGDKRQEGIAHRVTLSLEDAYKKLWEKWPGRPLTYAMRDCWYKYELFGQALWFVIGIGVLSIVLHYHLPLWLVPVTFGVYTWGYLNGHLFFGKPYQPGQTDATDDYNGYKPNG